MNEYTEESFWYEGFYCIKKLDETVSIGPEQAGIFINRTGYLGNASPIKQFDNHVVIPQYALDDATGKKYRVTEVRSSCFDGAANIETIDIPDSISNMVWSFWNCIKLRQIHIDSKNEHYCDVEGVVYSKDKEELIVFPPAYPEEEYHILPSTHTIRNLALKQAQHLKTLYIPASVHTIGINAFYRCRALKNVYIEGKLKSFMEAIKAEEAPKNVIFHYQGKEWTFGELQKEVNQQNNKQ
ncbi:MAG: leucine-rich repeat protein [Lentimicrobiaceae bacterium]|nr:leucine-rich repeat protein [Lentimicrobiaceae bacterium]